MSAVHDRELSDTVETERARRRCRVPIGSPTVHVPDATLARQLVGEPTSKRRGRCRYCGGPASNGYVCHAHSDLAALDTDTSRLTRTRTTTGPGSASPAETRATRATQEAL